MIWGQKMDKNEKLWFSTKKRPSYHNILWSEDFRDTRCCGEQANKICLLFYKYKQINNIFVDIYVKVWYNLLS